MPDYSTSDLIFGLSNIVEPAYNTLVTLSANFMGVRTRGRGFPLPDREKGDDRGVIGNQSSAPTQQRSGFLIPPTMEITEVLSTELPLVYARRALGGADVTSVIEAGIAHQHLISILGNYTAAGRQLPSSSIGVGGIGGGSILYGGCMFDTFRVDAAGVGDPTFTTGIVGSGLWKAISAITPALVIPKPTAQNYMLGAESKLIFNDGAARDLTVAPQRLQNFSFTYNNAHDTGKRKVGDPKLVTNDFNQGWYVNRMPHGDQTYGATMLIDLDQNMSEFAAAHNNTVITDFKWRAQAGFIGASVLNRYTFEIWFEKCFFRGTRGQDTNTDATMSIDILPVESASITSAVKIRVVNGSSVAVV